MELVQVPDLANTTLEMATMLLSQANLKLGGWSSEDSSATAGIVLRSRPRADQRVAKGTRIDLVLASGFNLVPDVVGRSLTEAKADLRAEGFEPLAVAPLATDAVQPGTVIDQRPLARAPQAWRKSGADRRDPFHPDDHQDTPAANNPD